MRKTRRTAGLAAAMFLTLASAASAASPIKGALYTGTLNAGVAKPITLKVSATGTTASLTWYCGVERQKQHIVAGRATVRITAGAFRYAQYPGQKLGWAASGRWATTTSATIHLQPYTAACLDQRGGTTTLHRAP
jgi:hypothetical protein